VSMGRWRYTFLTMGGHHSFLLCCCAGLATIMKGSLDTKLELIFEVYDSDGPYGVAVVKLCRSP